MTIEIRQPELEAIIQQRMASGLFESVEEVLLDAFKSSPLAQEIPSTIQKQSFVELFEPVRGMFTEDELNFSRNPSTGRPIDLA